LPRTSKADFAAIRCILGIGFQGTVIEDKSHVILFGIGSGEITVVFAGKISHIQVTVQEIGICITKHKVYRTLDITVFHKHPCACSMEIEGILTAQEPAIFEIHLVSHRTQGYSRGLLSLLGMVHYVIAVLECNAAGTEPGGIGGEQYSTTLIGAHIVFIL